MHKRLVIGLAAGMLALASANPASAQTYSNTVMALAPVAYWPLAETTPPPTAGMYVATNLGTAGIGSSGYYETWWANTAPSYALYSTNNIAHAAGPLAGDSSSASMVCGSTGRYLVVPRATNGVANPAVTLQAPFSVEFWAYIASTNTQREIVVEGGNNILTGPEFGNAIGQEGIEMGYNKTHFYWKTFAGPGVSANSLTGFDTLVPGTWHHVVLTFDGTVKKLYDNGAVKTATLSTKNSLGQLYVPDLVSPLILGNGNQLGAGTTAVFDGNVAEVALYTNVLSATTVTNHYTAGTNTAPAVSYVQTVINDNPTIYLRLNEPAFSGPTPSSLPVAANYGSLGASANGLYQPGTAPGVAGPPYAGFGPSSLAVAINGFNGGVDVGGGTLPSLLNPTNNQPLSVMTWFRANPADVAARYQTLVGHGTNSWRLGWEMTNSGNYFNPGAGPQLAFTNTSEMLGAGMSLNDGQWHFAAGVSDGTNDYLYLDGLLVKIGTAVASVPGNLQDVILGGDPNYLSPQPSAPTGYRGGLFFDGSIAQVAFFTNALSASQIQQLYGAAQVPLSIYQQPQSNQVNSGTSGPMMTFGVRGSSPLYQWYQTNTTTGVVSPVAGQTTASLTFNPATLANNGFYFAIATNIYGSAVTSAVAQLVVVGPPVIQQQTLTDIRVFAGTTPTLHVAATGPSLAYQWTSNSVPLPGATNAAYTLTTNATAAVGSTIYGCSITNSYGTANINNITVAVLADPTALFPSAVLADKPAAYFRLNEGPDNGSGNNGVTAYDYAGGNNAVYNQTTLGQSSYSPVGDPTTSSALFGSIPLVGPNNDYAGNVPSYLNFAVTNGGNAQFSVEAWIQQFLYNGGGNCIVALGTGSGGEQFVLDTGGNGSAGYLRFFVHNAAGTTFKADTTISLTDSQWHHVVGVCDEAGGHVYIYLDGALVGTGTIPAGSGLLSPTAPLSIGARQSGNVTPANYDFQFLGQISDVAIYGYALSAAQVQAHRISGGVAPVITQIQPASQDINENSTASITVTATGTTPFTYQWMDNYYSTIAGATNATLTLSNVQPIQTGYYTVTVSNPYGSATTNAYLNVNQGAPVLTVDLHPTNLTVWATTPVTYYVTASGSPPFSYQWYRNGSPIPGATGPTNTFLALLGTNTYQCAVTNAYSYTYASGPTYSSVGTVVGMPITTLNPSNYTDRLKITFAGYNRGETLADFPVLVRLSANLTGFNYGHFASSTGGDLRFTDASGTRVLPHEIDEWNPAGESTVWVQVPTLSSSNDCIWAYWGNPADTTAPAGTNVWVPQPWEGVPGFDLVYHMKESALPLADSAQRFPAINGVVTGSGVGIAGAGMSFDGASNYVSAGSLNLSNSFTLSTWINISTAVANIQTVWASKEGAGNSNGLAMNVNSFNTTDGALRFVTGNGSSTTASYSSAGAVSFGQWHLVTASVDTTSNTARLYVDGTDVTVAKSVLASFSKTNNVLLGMASDASWKFLGTMDEARVEDGTRSSNWVWASYMTVAQNATWQSYSSVTSSVVAPPVLGNMSYQFQGPSSLILRGSGGLNAAGASYQVWSSTNVALPLANWTHQSTNVFDSSGNYSVTNAMDPTKPRQFFRIVAPY